MNCLCGSKWGALEAGLVHAGRGTGYRPAWECLLHDGLMGRRPHPHAQCCYLIRSPAPSFPSPLHRSSGLDAPLGASYPLPASDSHPALMCQNPYLSAEPVRETFLLVSSYW